MSEFIARHAALAAVDAGLVLRAAVAYALTWCVIAVIPALVWSQFSVELFLKYWARIIWRGNRFVAEVVLKMAYWVPYIICMVVWACLLGLYEALVHLLKEFVLPLVTLSLYVASLGSVLAWLFFFGKAVVAFVAWDLQALGELEIPLRVFTALAMASVLIYAKYHSVQTRKKRLEELKKKRRKNHERRREQRRQALQKTAAPQQQPSPVVEEAPESERRVTSVMEAVHPEVVAEAMPALRRSSSRLTRREPQPKTPPPRELPWD